MKAFEANCVTTKKTLVACLLAPSDIFSVWVKVFWLFQVSIHLGSCILLDIYIHCGTKNYENEWNVSHHPLTDTTSLGHTLLLCFASFACFYVHIFMMNYYQKTNSPP